MSNITKLFLLFLLTFPFASFASPSICEVLKLDNCNSSKRALSRSNSASFPNSTSAAFNNPSALSMEKGFGIESIFFNQVGRVGLISGSGRVGAALSNSSSQESFFGNFALESPFLRRKRIVEHEVYDPDNLSLAAAANLFGNNKRKGFQVDVGGIYKRNNTNKKNYYGMGATISFNKIISVGYSKYNDVFYEDLRNTTINTYDESKVPIVIETDDSEVYLTDTNVGIETLVMSLKIGNFAFDHLTIKSTFDDPDIEPTYVKIFNTSVFYRKWILSYGKREEESFNEAYNNKVFSEEKFKYNTFIGSQYAIGDGLLIGVFHNYYLLNEWSLGLILFI